MGIGGRRWDAGRPRHVPLRTGQGRPTLPEDRRAPCHHVTCCRRAPFPPPAASARPMRLLCADDEEDIRTILQLALGLDPELEVELVDSGMAALTRAASGDFDAIVLDAMMPGLDGYETCRRLKQAPETAAIPIVFLTA